MQFPPELRGGQPFLTTGLPTQQPPATTTTTTFATAPIGQVPLCLSGGESSPWVQTVPDAMPWGTYPANSSATEVMRFSAGGGTLHWAVNERRFRKRHLPPTPAEIPPRKLTITEEKITAQLSDLSLDGCGSSCEEQQEPLLHVLCPNLEPPSPEPLLPRPLLEDLRKRTTMAVVLWQPPLVPASQEEAAEPQERPGEQEEDASMEELPECGTAHTNHQDIGHI